MKWLMNSGNQSIEIDLPATIEAGKPLTARVGGEEVTFVWQSAQQVLALARDVGGVVVHEQYFLRDCVVDASDDEPQSQVSISYRGPNGQISQLQAATEVLVPGMASRRSQSQSQGAVIKSPMAGTVLKVLVAADDEVQKGQVLCVIEAMKMENEIKAPVAGRVADLKCLVGSSVQSKEKLMILKP